MSNPIRLTALAFIAFALVACSQAAPPEPTQAVPPTGIPEETGSDVVSTLELAEIGTEASFALDPELSEARFAIGEILANAPNTVIGVNSRIQGGGVLNVVDPQLSRLDEFVIDASSFVTDSGMRNRAIRDFILQSAQYPSIRFQPTAIRGLPTKLAIGEIVPFEVGGLLTIRDITQEVTFSGEASMVADDRIEGSASTTVLRSDFDLRIPTVPRVASVDEEFLLEIQFVAVTG